MFHLCKRLAAVMNMVQAGVPVADIGCDHGQLSCALIQRGTPWVAASDISAPSLEKTRRLGEELGIGDRLKLRVGDGMAGMPDGIGTAVIAGLSAHTIEAILSADLERARGLGPLVLQPMQDIEGLRRFLMNSEFMITDEDIVYENRRYYFIVQAVSGKARYTRSELDFGPILLKKRHPLLQQYLLWKIHVVQRASSTLQGTRRMFMDKEIVRLEAVRQKLATKLQNET